MQLATKNAKSHEKKQGKAEPRMNTDLHSPAKPEPRKGNDEKHERHEKGKEEGSHR